MMKRFSATLCLFAAWNWGYGQLAITEVMSSAATNLGPDLVTQRADFFELTNFGTNTVDLTGYRFDDDTGGVLLGDPTPFDGVMMAPGESIIFAQLTGTVVTNAEQFRAWWGPGLSPTAQIYFYSGNGFSSLGDMVRVWDSDAIDDADVVHAVAFGEALRGVTFTYNPVTGEFGQPSTHGMGGAFRAAETDDVGSPGTTSGPVPLAITQQPASTSVNPGDTAVFTVRAVGIPPPSFYQWFFNDAPIPGAVRSSVSVTNAGLAERGLYRVELGNGFETLVSSNATLALNALPEPPRFLAPLHDQNVFIDQTVTFTVMASGVPQPTYQWRINGIDQPEATNESFVIFGAQPADAAVYSVVASNSQGGATNEAALVVTRRPRLVVTEVMSSQSTNGPFGGHQDWWELTNLDDFTVDLKGYRFDDGSAMLATSAVLSNAPSIAPGESIVFVENMTPEEFRRWWGYGRLPASVQIVSYRGGALSLSSVGDAVNVWNMGATEDADMIASDVFSTATAGVSFGFDPDTETFGGSSELGLRGAFQALENGDIGSPGFIRNPPNPRLLRILHDAGGCRLIWTAETGKNYTVEFKASLDSAGWNTLTNLTALDRFVTVTDLAGGIGQRYYRVVRND